MLSHGWAGATHLREAYGHHGGFVVKVAHLTVIGGLQWPLDVYGDVAVRNYLFRRDRNNCQMLTSAQARPMLLASSLLL